MNNQKKERSAAQKRADSRYEKQRATFPRLPAGRISMERELFLIKLAEIYGSKTEAIGVAIDLLAEKNNLKNSNK